MHLRETAREIFLSALRSVDVRSTTRQALAVQGTRLQIGGTSYDLSDHPHIVIIAVGKAAVPMTEGLLKALDASLTSAHMVRGVVVGSVLPRSPDPRLAYLPGSHPLPSADSADAARRILHLLHTANERTLIFFLLSGGASAMVELPLSAAISLEELTAFYATLVHSGLSIGEMNTLRKHLSAVKGGRLAAAAPAPAQCTLLVSDVPPSRPEVIGSGPSLPDPTTLQDCRYLLASKLAGASVPASIRAVLESSETPETPKPGDLAFARATYATLLSSDDLARAAQTAAQARGFHAVIDGTPDEWSFAEAASYLLDRSHELGHTHPDQPVCLISAGEVAVPVDVPDPGTGGRNQHLALHCALQQGIGTHPFAILSAGSDGADGNSPAAGAVIDETSLVRAAGLGLDPAAFLARFDSFSVFQALGDAILTGPTGNNLRDLRLFLIDRT